MSSTKKSDSLSAATVALYTAADARTFVSFGIAVKQVVALTPAALSELRGYSGTVRRSSEIYGDRKQAYAVVRNEKAMASTRQYVAQKRALEPVLAGALFRELHYLGGFALSLWYLLGDDGPYVLIRGSDWKLFEAKEEAHLSLFEQIMSLPECRRIFLRRAFMPQLTNALTLLALRFARGTPSFAITSRRSGLARVQDEFLKQSKNFSVSLRLSVGSILDPAFAVISLVRAISGTRRLEVVVAPHVGDCADVRKLVEDIIDQIEDSVIRRALEKMCTEVAQEISLTDRLRAPIKNIFNRAGVRVLLTDSARWGQDLAAVEAARDIGAFSLLASHGTHPVSDNRISELELKAIADGLLHSASVDVSLCQSPLSARALSAYSPASGFPIQPLVWGRVSKPTPRPSDRLFRILHAGSLRPLPSGRPWVYETTDELAGGIEKLVACVGGMRDVELIIRVFDNVECNDEALKSLLPRFDNVRLDRTGSFAEAATASDLVVSYSSTTIEEALNLRRPVLIWGGSARYAHIEGCEKAPANGSRAAVYRATDTDSLQRLLGFIVSSHANAPLEDDELAGLVWPDSVITASKFIERKLRPIVEEGADPTTVFKDDRL